jgi:multidrug efflux pump subunit AcrA (membrane-fusion protein)
MTKKTTKQPKESIEQEIQPPKDEKPIEVEEVKAEKVEDPSVAREESKKSQSTKYHFSVKLTPEKLEDAVQEAESPPEPPSSKTKKEAKEEVKEEKQAHFTKEAEAVSSAETPKQEDVQHIKYSGQDLTPSSQGKDAIDDTSAPIKLEDIKRSIETLKKDRKAFKELQNFVRPPLPVIIKKELEKRVSLKYWNATLIGTMKGIDFFINYVTKPSSVGRNQAVQKARSPIMFGLWVLFAFFIVGGFWAGFAPLDQATHGQGFIVTSSKKQVIQHREGGILQAIYVKEGDHVKAEQKLAQLTDAHTANSLKSFYANKDSTARHLKATQGQLKAMKELARSGFIAQVKVQEQEAKEGNLQAQLSEIEAKIATTEESLARLTLRSPVNGIVTQVNINTIGGVVGQQQPIMTITPTEEDLILEAYVRAQDIEPVHVGLKAHVNIAAFRSKTTSHLDGIVTYVSPDVVDFVQQQGRSSQEGALLQRGAAFYKVRISIDKKQLKKISKVKDYELTPGMEADVQITVGERTLVQYLMDPILGSFWHALKEK